MGHQHAKPERLKTEAKSKFDKRELMMIKNAFHDLCIRSSTGKSVTKVAFLRRFSLPGILGERLFSVFDPKDTGGIQWVEFMIGMGYVLRGTDDEKNEMIFRMADIQATGKVTVEDMAMFIYSMAAIRIRSPSSRAVLSADDEMMLTEEQADAMIREAFTPDTIEEGMDAEAFKDWLNKHPQVRQSVEGVFYGVTDSSVVASEYAKMRMAIKEKKNAGSLLVPGSSRRNTTDLGGQASPVAGDKLSNPNSALVGQAAPPPTPVSVNCMACMGKLEVAYDMYTGGPIDTESLRYCPFCGNALEIMRSSNTISATAHEGFLNKVGHRFKQVIQRWFVIRNGFLHEFHNPKNTEAICSTFLPGCYVEAVSEREKAKRKFGFEIIMMEEPRKSRLLYSHSIEERDQWIKDIKAHAVAVAPWGEYKRMDELGVGRFSSVICAENIATRKKYAMKIIEKVNLDEKEQEALHTEIAVLRMVRHPNILSLKAVFETRRQIFIITNLVSGGDLFERFDQRKIFPERRAREIIRKLLNVVEYLHCRGIVHRDLKPENILCTKGEEFDIILGDFGLSKFAGSQQVMKTACGTPAYVAPEVWSMNGYDSKVDLWSVGVMLYLFLSGRLPFNGKDRKELQQATLHSKLLFSAKIWAEISEDAKDLVKKLLDKNPKKRATAKSALSHRWFEQDTERKSQGGRNSEAPTKARNNVKKQEQKNGKKEEQKNGSGLDNGDTAAAKEKDTAGNVVMVDHV
mmetsp:Transcript_28919/g.50870  ORF Transcript_28919/g.50870 Transcript_28919/m.50870 type:complete len:742 (-) Transcript_28919:250-2475(-)